LNTERAGFTLLEFTVVVIIIGILATITISLSSKSREDSIDKEAIANLLLIQAAEKTVRMIEGNYTSPSDTSSVNSALRLSLPTAAGYLWDYKVAATSDLFTAKAQRTTSQLRSGESQRVKCIDQDDSDPFTTGCAW